LVPLHVSGAKNPGVFWISEQDRRPAEAKRKVDLLDRRTGFTKLKVAPKFDEFAEQFLEWSKQQHRPKTQELHSGNCDTLKRFFRGKWMDEITHGMVEDFKLARIREKRWGEQKRIAVSAVTVNRALSTLRLMYNYAERCGFQVSNPVKHVEFFKETGRERIITLQEEVAYLAAASQPLKDIARIMLDTGMRPQEVFRIERTTLTSGSEPSSTLLGRRELPGAGSR
jgi:site-specific recombinase XerD